MSGHMQQTPLASPGAIGIHRGAIDQTTITTESPPAVMKRVREVLEGMGIAIQVESEFKYRCVRAKRPAEDTPAVDGDNAEPDPVLDVNAPAPTTPETTPKARSVPLPQAAIDPATSSSTAVDSEVPNASSPPHATAYGQKSEESGDEVRFSVELTRLDRLVDTYSLDIRRLKGNLRSYKFVYDTLRQLANLQR